ncbi:hypothetical protein SO694_00137069 [Aureococcus anophagefferens]|uniref:alpha-L-rhamnosidase n=1 Tax=Aureococcus anophagefferens TaxID=44056 RepID=A0ABR1GG25_AURAN
MLLAALAARAAAAVPGMLLLALAARAAATVPVTNATVPLWTSNSSCEYVQLRASFPLATPPRSITVYATAQATEKLLGAYKLWVNGVALAEGPGRALSSETQLVDVVDVDPSNADALALAVQGYKQKGGGRILVTTKIVHADGTVEIFGSDATWKANCLDGAARQECCLGGNYHAPRENWALDAFPAGWTGATFDDASWEPAAAQKAFAPLEAKASRPVGRFDDWRRAVAMTEVKETVCAAAPQNERLYLTCNGTSTIEAVVFADFGAPSGACAAPRGAAAAGMIPTQNANASGSPANSFETDATCTSTDAHSKIEALCVGRTSCDLGSDSRTFGSPSNACPASKWAAVAVKCAAAAPSYRYVVDLGAELQGGVLLRVPAHDRRRAADVVVRLGEARLPNGSVEFHMTTGNDYEERWAPYEDGSESVFDMGHEYREFRWAEVANSPAPLEKGDVGAWIVRYPLDAAASTFASASDRLDAVWALGKDTIVATALDVNTDSNTRQRDNCGVDAHVALTGQLATTADVSLPLRSLGFSLRAGDGVRPSWVEDKLSAVWGLAAVLRADPASPTALALANRTYAALKNLTLLPAYYDASAHVVVKGNPSWLQKNFPNSTCEKCEPDLVDYPGQYLDGYDSPNNRSTSTNAHVLDAARDLATIARALAATDNGTAKQAYLDDAEAHDAVADAIAATLSSEAFFDGTVFFDGDGSTHASIAAQYLAWGAGAPKNPSAAALRAFAAAVANKTFGRAEPAYSCMGAYWVLRALYGAALRDGDADYRAAARGAAEVARRVLVADETWQLMLAAGATATMEVWTVADKGNPTWSHPWCSAPATAVPAWLGGVAPAEGSPGRLLVRPQPGALSSFELTAPTPSGAVAVALAQDAHVLNLTVTIPANATGARVCLPRAADATGDDAADALTLDGAAVDAPEFDGHVLRHPADLPPGTHALSRASA